MIPTRVRTLVTARSLGRCEGCLGIGRELHHRRTRGMGGGDGREHCPENLVRLCRSCHSRATDEPLWAERNGLLVPHRERTVHLSEARLCLGGRIWVRLTPASTYRVGAVSLRNLGEVFDVLAAVSPNGVRPPNPSGAFEPTVPPLRVVEEGVTGDSGGQRVFLTVSDSGVPACAFISGGEQIPNGHPDDVQEIQALDGIWDVVDPVSDEAQIP